MEPLLKEACQSTGCGSAALVSSDGLLVASYNTVATNVFSGEDARLLAMMARSGLRLHDSSCATTFQPSRYIVNAAGGDASSATGGGGGGAQVLMKSASMDSLQSSNLAGFADNSNLFSLLVDEQFLSEWQAKTGFQSVLVETSERCLECTVVAGQASPSADADQLAGKLLTPELDAAMFLVTTAVQ